MQKIPLLSGSEVVKAFRNFGCEVARGTLRSLIARAGLSVEEFLCEIK